MPKQVEERLRREALEKFPGDQERQDRYVYGTMHNKLHWTRGKKKPAQES